MKVILWEVTSDIPPWYHPNKPGAVLRPAIPAGYIFESQVIEPTPPEMEEAMHLDSVALRVQQANLDSPDPVFQHVRLLGYMDADKTPSRKFLDCWRLEGRSVAVDMALARGQTLASIRKQRDERLLVSDKDKHRLDDIGTAEQKAALATYRQQLRDLPATVSADLAKIEDATTLEKYAPVWPAKPV